MRMTSSVALLLAHAACTITQEVQPVETLSSHEICIIENSEVRKGFLTEYSDALEDLAYRVRVLPPRSELTTCPIVSTYTAQWSWDWFWTAGVYMSFAEIKVYREGNRIGEATYDARGGDANPKLVTRAGPKIRELVEDLFPPPPAGAPATGD